MQSFDHVEYPEDPAATLATASQDVLSKFVFEEITSFLVLVGQHWTVDQKSEYIGQCISELSDVPIGPLVKAARHARRRASFPGQFIPMIFERVEVEAGR